MANRLGRMRMIIYLDGLPLIKPQNSLIARSDRIT